VSLRVIGHDEQRRRLAQAWKAGKLAHAYLFVGPNGVGKRTFARQFAQVLLCRNPNVDALEPCGECESCKPFEAGNHPDFFEISMESDRNEFRINVIRDFLPQLGLKPALSGERVAVIDDADLFSEEAANALLKTLEEPPPRSRLLLIASRMEGMLPTIRSRCQRIAFTSLSIDEAAEALLQSGLAESSDRAKSLAELSEGSLADVEQLADDEWRQLRPRILERFSAPSFDLVRFGRDVNKFCENAGKESGPKRRRAALVIRTVLDLYQTALRSLETLGESATTFTEAGLLDAIERTIDADEQVKRYLHLATVVDCWMDDLAQIAAGVYSPA
jgi:DNA polymerase-3 subunit delta'